MLVNNVGGEKAAASMVKDSKFYIDLAKFVQAYSMIVLNPNEFLKEVGETEIDPENDFLTWAQFVKIMQTCDLGFSEKPTETDLVVFYNYALEMGSLGDGAKKIASVEDVANAQKHFYNFIDESADKAEMAYLRQQEISSNRDREAKNVDSSLFAIKAKNITALTFMVIGVIIFCGGLVSLFVDNIIASSIGGLIIKTRPNILGGIVLMIVGIIIFISLNGLFLKTKYAYLRLKDASKTIFERSDAAFNDTLVLRNKLTELKEDLKVVKDELADKNKTNDVMKNIENLIETNKYYQQFSSGEIMFESSAKPTRNAEGEFAPVNLSKDERENLRNVSKEAINLTGTFDEEAYNAKFEQKRESGEKDSKKQEEDKYVASEQDNAILNEEETKKLQEIEKEQLEQENASNEQDIDYLKEILGLGE